MYCLTEEQLLELIVLMCQKRNELIKVQSELYDLMNEYYSTHSQEEFYKYKDLLSQIEKLKTEIK
ncbi:MAG: hypothetical protein HQK96_03845 [Nitrospirae bacterium]|nr:hypothetical protein [Nitrospirota bacterium]